MSALTITIDPEFRDLIPALSPEELEQLHISLSSDGCLSPLIVWRETGILVDGHNRHAFLTKHEKEIPIRDVSFYDRREAIQFIIMNQLGRRNVSPETASILRGKLHESMKMQVTNPTGVNKHEKEVECKNCTQPTTAEVVAKKTGVSARTVTLDAKLVRALAILKISESDYMAGKVMENGKKRTKGSIIAEAFPVKSPTTDREGTEESKKPKRIPTWKPDDADHLWLMAKTDLDKILKSDISRERVLLEVVEYCQSRMSTKVPPAPTPAREMTPWGMARHFIKTLQGLPTADERGAICDVMQHCQARLAEIDAMAGAKNGKGSPL